MEESFSMCGGAFWPLSIFSGLQATKQETEHGPCRTLGPCSFIFTPDSHRHSSPVSPRARVRNGRVRTEESDRGNRLQQVFRCALFCDEHYLAGRRSALNVFHGGTVRLLIPTTRSGGWCVK
jgi:hypothetical protein